jgi:hypothetical protein
MAPLPRARPTAKTTQPPATTAPPAAAYVPGDVTSWWLSTERMTVCVDLDANGIIVAAPPIVRKFIGQPASGRGATRFPELRRGAPLHTGVVTAKV